jgi:hypothetical protein
MEAIMEQFVGLDVSQDVTHNCRPGPSDELTEALPQVAFDTALFLFVGLILCSLTTLAVYARMQLRSEVGLWLDWARR